MKKYSPQYLTQEFDKYETGNIFYSTGRTNTYNPHQSRSRSANPQNTGKYTSFNLSSDKFQSAGDERKLSLQNLYYSYNSRGHNKQFAVKRKSDLMPDSQTNVHNRKKQRGTIPSSQYPQGNKGLLTLISQDIPTIENNNVQVMQPQSQIGKRFRTFSAKQRQKCDRIHSKIERRPKTNLNRSYVDFCIRQMSPNNSFTQTALTSFYSKKQILQLREEEEYIQNIQKQIRQQSQLPIDLDTQAEDGQINPYKDTQNIQKISPNKRVSIQISKNKKEEQNVQQNRKPKLSTLKAKESLICTAEEAHKRMQKSIHQWIEQQNDILGVIQQNYDNFQNMMNNLYTNYPIKQENESKRKSQVWNLKRDLIKRIGLLSKSSSMEKQSSFVSKHDTVSMNSKSSLENKIEKEQKSFVYQLLTVEQPKPRSEGHRTDSELEQKMNEYWQFDRRGRNVALMQKKSKKKKYGVVFSRGVKNKFDKMKELMVLCVKKLRLMKLTAEELLSGKVILKKPYQREGSYIFFKALEKGNFDLIQLHLIKCRYYVFDLDYNLQTALHIVATKGETRIVKLLLENGAYTDQLDLAGRTPLWYALFNDNTEIVKYLLSYQANPWSFNDCDYSQATENAEMQKLLKIARRLNLLLLMTPYLDREKVWEQYKDLFFKYFNKRR